jgi:hypothetical protein
MKRAFAFPTILLLIGLYTPCKAAPTNSILQKQVGSFHIEEFGVDNALRDITFKVNVAIGFDEVISAKETTLVFDFAGGTVSDLFNAFVQQVPGYSWREENDGVIHVFRDSGHIPLSDVTMSYPGALNKTRRAIWEDIANRPEITAWLDSAHCSRGELFNGKEFRDHNNPISIPYGVMTLGELLDKVAIKSGVNFWTILQASGTAPCQVYIKLW